MPGLINGHAPCAYDTLRNYADDKELQTWLFDYIFPAEEKLEEGMSTMVPFLELWKCSRSGTTCFIDMYFFMDDIAEAVEKSGIRAHLSRGVSTK